MMINKRLINTVKESKKYIAGNVICQWLSLAANITMMGAIARMLQNLYEGTDSHIGLTAVIAAAVVCVRAICVTAASRMGYLSSRAVKKTLREMICRKLLRLGSSYKEQANTSEVVQVAVEGVDQLETYFGAYLPQFFYAMLAPLTLFGVLCFVNVPSAILLLVCVPMIPVTIMLIQRWAKKLLGKYWGQYTALGDTFLENLQGLTTTKIYQADEFKHREMNEQSEQFRKITMKVLTMQLNSITVMDLIAYGGAALGVILATTQFRAGYVNLEGCILIILLAADFFLPMRLLGSFFHIAMNGMAASDKIFRLLDLPEPGQKTEAVPEDCSMECKNLRFSYDGDREILHGVDMTFPKGSFTAIVGESGCGKSTIASILMGRNKGYGIHRFHSKTPMVPVRTVWSCHDSGNFCYRSSWEEDASFTAMKCGTLGSSHGHADQTQLLLHHRGKPFLIDSGRYTYVEEDPLRPLLKKPFAHNVCVIDDWSGGEPNGSWSYHRYDETLKNYDCHIDGAHFTQMGFHGTLKDGTPYLVQRRVMSVDSGIWLSAQDVICQGEHEVKEYFHLHADVNVSLEQGSALLRNGSAALKLYADGALILREGIVSDKYNEKHPAPILIRGSRMRDRMTTFAVIADAEYHVNSVPVYQMRRAEPVPAETAAAWDVVKPDGTKYTLILWSRETCRGDKLFSCHGVSVYGKAVVLVWEGQRCRTIRLKV